MKPLGHKAYGSIGHLPASRIGPGDHHVHEGQATICTSRARDKHDRVIVTEKLDGSNVAVAKKGGSIWALTRSGYVADTSPYEQHHVFQRWVEARDFASLPEGFRVSGEWMYHAHGTIYEPDAPLICFDVFDAGNRRLPHDAARLMFSDLNLIGAKVISDGPPLSIDAALQAVGEFGFHGAKEQVEGAVWRVERKGAFDFMAKFVRHDKQDGKYLAGVTGAAEIKMCDPIPGLGGGT
jgi:ATP-dependent RNA circularization protein (DNA/RNA ligase family)